MHARILTASLLLSAFMPVPQAEAQDVRLLRGERIVEAQCSRCHSTGRTGPSPHAKAPPFRELSRRYPIHFLAEALAEGIVTGHDDMPRFVFQPDEIDAILAYLSSISGS